MNSELGGLELAFTVSRRGRRARVVEMQMEVQAPLRPRRALSPQHDGSWQGDASVPRNLHLKRSGGSGCLGQPGVPAGQPGESDVSTILIVEDETPIRELLALILRDLGYKVEEAINGREAIAL